MNIPMEQVNTR